MTDLISRLSEAREGSRELSDECLLAVGWLRDYIPRPDPTRNLQDALDWMLPEGTAWSIAVDGGLCQALIFQNGEGVIGRGDATTPALAICAAALKAREAMKESDDG